MLAVAGRWRMRLMMGRCHVLDWVSWTPSGQIGDTFKLFDDTAWPPQKAHGLARNLWLVSPLQWNVLAVDLANAGAAAPAGGAPSGKNVPARHAGHYCPTSWCLA